MPKNVIETKTKESLLQLFLPKNDETQNLELQKVNEIDSKEIKRHLKKRESVYIQLKKEQKSDVNYIVCEGKVTGSILFAARNGSETRW